MIFYTRRVFNRCGKHIVRICDRRVLLRLNGGATIIYPDRPLFMQSQTGHCDRANRKALELTGVTKAKEPIDLFGKDGIPNGFMGIAAAGNYGYRAGHSGRRFSLDNCKSNRISSHDSAKHRYIINPSTARGATV